MLDVLNLIKARMEEQHISLETVAQKIGVSRQSVWAALNRKTTVTQKGKAGMREVSFPIVRKILDAVGLEASTKTVGTADPESLLRVAEETGISLSTLEKILKATGFELSIKEKSD